MINTSTKYRLLCAALCPLRAWPTFAKCLCTPSFCLSGVCSDRAARRLCRCMAVGTAMDPCRRGIETTQAAYFLRSSQRRTQKNLAPHSASRGEAKPFRSPESRLTLSRATRPCDAEPAPCRPGIASRHSMPTWASQPGPRNPGQYLWASISGPEFLGQCRWASVSGSECLARLPVPGSP